MKKLMRYLIICALLLSILLLCFGCKSKEKYYEMLSDFEFFSYSTNDISAVVYQQNTLGENEEFINIDINTCRDKDDKIYNSGIVKKTTTVLDVEVEKYAIYDFDKLKVVTPYEYDSCTYIFDGFYSLVKNVKDEQGVVTNYLYSIFSTRLGDFIVKDKNIQPILKQLNPDLSDYYIMDEVLYKIKDGVGQEFLDVKYKYINFDNYFINGDYFICMLNSELKDKIYLFNMDGEFVYKYVKYNDTSYTGKKTTHGILGNGNILICTNRVVMHDKNYDYVIGGTNKLLAISAPLVVRNDNYNAYNCKYQIYDVKSGKIKDIDFKYVIESVMSINEDFNIAYCYEIEEKTLNLEKCRTLIVDNNLKIKKDLGDCFSLAKINDDRYLKTDSNYNKTIIDKKGDIILDLGNSNFNIYGEIISFQTNNIYKIIDLDGNIIVNNEEKISNLTHFYGEYALCTKYINNRNIYHRIDKSGKSTQIDVPEYGDILIYNGYYIILYNSDELFYSFDGTLFATIQNPVLTENSKFIFETNEKGELVKINSFNYTE